MGGPDAVAQFIVDAVDADGGQGVLAFLWAFDRITTSIRSIALPDPVSVSPAGMHAAWSGPHRKARRPAACDPPSTSADRSFDRRGGSLPWTPPQTGRWQSRAPGWLVSGRSTSFSDRPGPAEARERPEVNDRARRICQANGPRRSQVRTSYSGVPPTSLRSPRPPRPVKRLHA